MHPSALEEQLERLLADINLTTSILRSLPKVYWIWNHRLWCLSKIPHGPAYSVASEGDNGQPLETEVPESSRSKARPAAAASRPGTTWKQEAWERELLLVDKMLSVDPRNCTS